MTYAFVQEALPLLDAGGHRCPGLLRRQRRALRPAARERQQRASSPRQRAREAIGITGFTLPTLYRWVRSRAGPARQTLHPYRTGHYLGSGQGAVVLQEAGLDGAAQAAAVVAYARRRSSRS